MAIESSGGALVQAEPAVPVFRGTKAASLEFGLVLDAKGMIYDRIPAADAAVGSVDPAPAGGAAAWRAALANTWELRVAPAEAEAARDELARYAAERAAPRHVSAFVPFPGSAPAAGAYAGVLVLVAYLAGIQAFGVDWLGAGAIESTAIAAREWWRPITALTLHLDQEHLLGNLLFGMGIGILAARTFGAGIAWLGIVLAGALANGIDMWVSPPWHRAVGASTAVFAALGLLAGFGWGERQNRRERRLYRWAPLAGGIALLALLGAGDEHVDVLGHFLGFVMGTGLGWAFAHPATPRTRRSAPQWAAGGVAVLIVALAWCVALRYAV